MRNIVLVVAIVALAIIAVSALAPGNPLSRLFQSKEVVVVTPVNDDSALSSGGLASPTESARAFEIIPVVDLRKRFSLPVTDETADNRIVVVDIDGQGIGMVVDAVAEVMRINSGSIEPPSEAITTQESDYLLGIAKLDDRLIILLDMNKLLLKEERQALAQTDMTPEPATA